MRTSWRLAVRRSPCCLRRLGAVARGPLPADSGAPGAASADAPRDGQRRGTGRWRPIRSRPGSSPSTACAMSWLETPELPARRHRASCASGSSTRAVRPVTALRARPTPSAAPDRRPPRPDGLPAPAPRAARRRHLVGAGRVPAGRRRLPGVRRLPARRRGTTLAADLRVAGAADLRPLPAPRAATTPPTATDRLDASTTSAGERAQLRLHRHARRRGRRDRALPRRRRPPRRAARGRPRLPARPPGRGEPGRSASTPTFPPPGPTACSCIPGRRRRPHRRVHRRRWRR